MRPSAYLVACSSVALQHNLLSRHKLLSSTSKIAIVPIHHPNPAILVELAKASGPSALLRIFDREAEQYGWATAQQTINRLAKGASKRAGAFKTSDERFQRVLDVPVRALQQGVMSTTARLGRASDDLSSLKESLEKLKLKDHELHRLLTAKLDEEEADGDTFTHQKPYSH
jgi:hypothetical protein